MRLVLELVRAAIAEAPSEKISVRRLDWNLVLQLAVRHSVVPLLYTRLVAYAGDWAPATFQVGLRQAYLGSVSRALLLTEELRRVLEYLRMRTIRTLAYKGPALAAQLYGDASVRSYQDLDLLVRSADFAAARRALAEVGYLPRQKLTGAQERAVLHTECDQALIQKRRGTLLELHWAVAPPYFSFPFSTDELFARAVAVELPGFLAAAPGPEDLLLLLAMNAMKDLWTRLEPACLMARLLYVHQNFDWPLVIARARALHAERMLTLALCLTAEVLGTPLPVEVQPLVRKDFALQSLVEEAKRHLFDGHQPASGSLAGTLFRLRARERWTDRARYCVLRALLPTSADCAFLPFPSPLWPVAALVRPFRLLARATGRAAKTISLSSVP
jgi:hypothetical protein